MGDLGSLEAQLASVQLAAVREVDRRFHAFDGEPDTEMLEGEDAFEPPIEHAERDFTTYQASVGRARKAVAARHLDDIIELPHWVADDQPKVLRPTSLGLPAHDRGVRTPQRSR
jgi:hypothetical protein